MPRKTGKLKTNKTFLLVVEGQTEAIYFRDITVKNRIHGVTITPKIAKHSDLNSILETAVTEQRSGAFDSVWCVFDCDTIISNGMSDDLKKKYDNAKKSGIHFADSLPAFEVWFLLHFAVPSQFYSSQKAVISDLRRYIQDYSKDQKWLSSGVLYSKLKQHFDDAMERAKELDTKRNTDNTNATFSHVYKLFKELLPVVKNSIK